MEKLERKDWQASLDNLETNYKQASMAKMMIEKQMELAKGEIALLPIEVAEKPKDAKAKK